MRLGDLDALKEDLFIKFGNQLPNGLLDEIDNAPTVEYTFEEAFQKTVCKQKLYCPKVCGNNPKWCESCVSKGKCASTRPQSDLIKAFELLKAHCKNRECNKDCVFYRELRVGDETEQFCGLCEIVMNDDKENNNND